MEIELNRFTPAEQATYRLRALYEQAGYRKYRASRFEEYALYQEYQRFLPDAQVITFTDLDGKLRAIKPDVTLSIAKTAQPAAGECKRFYYNEEVCRPSRESHTFQTIHQMGLESMGAVDADEQAAVVRLALQSLAALDVPTVLEISHMGYLTGLLDALHVPAEARAKLLDFLRAKNAHELRTAALAAGLDESAAAALTGLLDLHGPLGATLAAARAACRCETQRAALEELQALQNALGEAGRGTRLDLSMADEMEYYNGLVFTGYVAGIPCAVLNSVQNAGSIFLGKNVPEALGDYFAGPNHTLPTSGTARFSSPLGVDDFVKKSSFIYYTLEALGEVQGRIANFAEHEGLHAHAKSVTIRFEE